MRRRRAEEVPATDVPVVDDPGAIDVERALRLVRMAAALIAMAAVLGSRATDGPGLQGPAAAGAIFAGAVGISLLTTAATRRGWRTLASLGGQVLDVAGSLGLVALLDGPLDGSGWMVLLLPIVMGGVRFGAPGTLLAWTLGCIGYGVLVVAGFVEVPGEPADELAASLQRFAFLLALAVPVAALTQWLQHRWEHQRALTVAASLRAQRLELIESLARSFIGSTEPRLLANLADAGVRLGFPTVSITVHHGDRSTTVAAVGEARDLPTDDVAVRPRPGETLVTHWATDERDDRTGAALTSASVSLDATGSEISFHGWQPGPLDEDLARAFGLLGAHAGVALRAARMVADLERQAHQDALTGLWNRRAFDDRIDRLAAEAAPVALLLLDVDHFKAINDTYGHQAGDKVLRVIAERLRSAVDLDGRPVDAAVARIGGDEFTVLLRGADLEQVAQIAERIETSMATPVAVDGQAITVSFSIGIADAEGTWEPRTVISAADDAAYQAKAHGRNRTCWAAGPVGEPDPTAPPAAPGDLHDAAPGASLITLFRRSMDASPETPTPITSPEGTHP